MSDPAGTDASVPAGPRRRRRAVGPPGARPPEQEPRAEAWTDQTSDREDPQDVARLLADVPPHHGPV